MYLIVLLLITTSIFLTMALAKPTESFGCQPIYAFPKYHRDPKWFNDAPSKYLDPAPYLREHAYRRKVSSSPTPYARYSQTKYPITDVRHCLSKRKPNPPILRIHYGGRHNIFTRLAFDMGFDIPSSNQAHAIRAHRAKKKFDYPSFLEMATKNKRFLSVLPSQKPPITTFDPNQYKKQILYG